MRVSDQESVDFHVQEKDYFATLATILELWKSRDRQSALSQQEITSDLKYLQDNYSIVPSPSRKIAKKLNKKRRPKGKLQNQ